MSSDKCTLVFARFTYLAELTTIEGWSPFGASLGSPFGASLGSPFGASLGSPFGASLESSFGGYFGLSSKSCGC